MESLSTRLLYVAGMLLTSALSLALRLMLPINYDALCGTSCQRVIAAYKVAFVMATYHALLMLATVRVSSSNGWRAYIHNRLWPVKFVLIVVALVMAFLFMSSRLFNQFHIAVFLFSAVFVVLQGLLLVDFAYVWAASMMERYESNPQRRWKVLLFGITILMYSAALAVSCYLFIFSQQTSCSSTSSMIIGINMTLIVILSLLSTNRNVHMRNERCGLLQSAFIACYTTYLIASAVTSDPRSCGSNQSTTSGTGETSSSVTFHDNRADLKLAVQIAGLIIALFSLSWTAFDSGSSTALTSPSGSEDEADNTVYSYSYFHYVFMLASFYTAAVITNWSVLTSLASDNATDLLDLNVDRGVGAYWIKGGMAWLICILYIWTLLAPLVIDYFIDFVN